MTPDLTKNPFRVILAKLPELTDNLKKKGQEEKGLNLKSGLHQLYIYYHRNLQLSFYEQRAVQIM